MLVMKFLTNKQMFKVFKTPGWSLNQAFGEKALKTWQNRKMGEILFFTKNFSFYFKQTQCCP